MFGVRQHLESSVFEVRQHLESSVSGVLSLFYSSIPDKRRKLPILEPLNLREVHSLTACRDVSLKIKLASFPS